MNRRNKLHINNAEAILNAMHSDTIILNPRLTADAEKQPMATLFSDADDADAAARPGAAEDGTAPGWRMRLLRRALQLRPYLLSAILQLAVFYVVNRPSGYGLLMDEICSLKRENSSLRGKLPSRNLACISNGARVDAASPLYHYGFMGRRCADPNCILEAGDGCLSLEGAAGEFQIRFPEKQTAVRFAIYHPRSGNPKSAMRRFSAVLGGLSRDFTFGGTGYEEFNLAGRGDVLRIRFNSNHGEAKYTSIYRVYVFG